MTTIANCRTLDEAESIRTFLDAMGIAAFIPDEAGASLVPHHFITRSGVRVQVAEEHVAEARGLLRSREQAADGQGGHSAP